MQLFLPPRLASQDLLRASLEAGDPVGEALACNCIGVLRMNGHSGPTDPNLIEAIRYHQQHLAVADVPGELAMRPDSRSFAAPAFLVPFAMLIEPLPVAPASFACRSARGLAPLPLTLPRPGRAGKFIAHCNLGLAYQALEQYDEATANHQHALR